MNINGETKIIGFFGSTYKTSTMYAIYNAAFDTLGQNVVYIPFCVDDLEKAVNGVKHLGIKAVGVSIPYKIDIIKYLDGLDRDAKRTGAVNVVVNKNGKLIGSNTDGKGAVKALQEVTQIKNKKILLLGGGGAARAIAFAVKDEGAEVIIINRTYAFAQNLAQAVGCRMAGMDKLAEEIKNIDILINATSVGMSPNENASPVPKSLLSGDLVVMDVVARPAETSLLKDAKEKGCSVVYAKRMLFWQAVLKFPLYTGIKPPISVMEKAIMNQK